MAHWRGVAAFCVSLATASTTLDRNTRGSPPLFDVEGEFRQETRLSAGGRWIRTSSSAQDRRAVFNGLDSRDLGIVRLSTPAENRAETGRKRSRSFVGEAGAAQADVKRTFGERHVLRISGPRVGDAQSSQRVEIWSELNCLGQTGTGFVELAVETKRRRQVEMSKIQTRICCTGSPERTNCPFNVS